MCRTSFIIWNSIACFLVAAAFGQSLAADSLRPAPNRKASSVQLTLHPKAECPSNLLLLSDLVVIQGSDALVSQLAECPIAPGPTSENEQTWTRADIEKALNLRGIASNAIEWRGSSECRVVRGAGPRIKPTPPTNQPASPVQTANHTEVTPGAVVPATATLPSPAPLDKSKFTSPFTTPTMVSQAERVATTAIENYLQTRTNSNNRWNVKVEMPTEHSKLFFQQRQILGIAGGQPPWEGEQEFTFLVKSSDAPGARSNQGEVSVTIKANIQLPEMVFAAKRPLSKGYVIKEDDLVWISMPRGTPFGVEDCFQTNESLVGKQLRRSVSTQQVIRQNEVGPPAIIQAGDLVGIEIVAGSVSVKTTGRAVESGGLDDLILIEVQPQRKRVLARITGEGVAEVISNGNNVPNQAQKASGHHFKR